jgi:hypothetical protein
MSKLPARIQTIVYPGHGKFFRSRLLISDGPQIAKILKGMDQEATHMRNEILKMCWYMRGGVTYSEVMNMSSKERDIINTIIKENLETTKKSGLPFF